MQISVTLLNLAGFLIALGIGLILFGLYNRAVYPAMRWRHEEAKVTGSHGRDPAFYLMLVKVVTLILLPVPLPAPMGWRFWPAPFGRPKPLASSRTAGTVFASSTRR